ncbi:unnamed protein product, partial [Prorocentrum cordatum]
MRSALAAHPPGEASARRGGARGAMAARLLGRGAVAAAVASAVQLEVERAGSPGAAGQGRDSYGARPCWCSSWPRSFGRGALGRSWESTDLPRTVVRSGREDRRLRRQPHGLRGVRGG